MSKASEWAEQASQRPWFHPKDWSIEATVNESGRLVLSHLNKDIVVDSDTALALGHWLVDTFQEEKKRTSPVEAGPVSKEINWYLLT